MLRALPRDVATCCAGLGRPSSGHAQMSMSTQAPVAPRPARVGQHASSAARARCRARAPDARRACAAVVCSAASPAKEYHVLAKAEIPAHLPRCANPLST